MTKASSFSTSLLYFATVYPVCEGASWGIARADSLGALELNHFRTSSYFHTSRSILLYDRTLYCLSEGRTPRSLSISILSVVILTLDILECVMAWCSVCSWWVLFLTSSPISDIRVTVLSSSFCSLRMRCFRLMSVSVSVYAMLCYVYVYVLYRCMSKILYY
jgi:hypothetical protein